MEQITYNATSDIRTNIFCNTEYSYYKELTKDHNQIIISCKTIFKKYPEIFKGTKYVIINDIEAAKSLKTVEHIVKKLIELKADRNTYLIGIGGGIVCDLTGFVAKIFMRGAKLGLIPTTLLAMVDAAIGGKNGVNFNKTKNFIGTFHNPEFVIIDPKFLKTLNKTQFASGLGEIIKYTLVDNAEIYNILINERKKIMDRDLDLMSEIITKAIQTKVKFIEEDPKDTSVRHILNFGHTIGHSIEVVEKIPHGMAVVKGINAIIDISTKTKILDNEKALSMKKLLTDYGYNINYTITNEHYKLITNDKKKVNDCLKLVLIKDFFEPVIEKIKIDSIYS
ncbi:MAG: 3-dehydroquinate synthase, partial [Bacteroidales bacterium]|nr:3-dehydroquinate synthase [Bacteroidales bacterium]